MASQGSLLVTGKQLPG
ncbi:hypothetical protein HaLaN_00806, partial [Haematococcus lacustris]